MQPFRAVCLVTQEQAARNIAHAKSLGLPYVQEVSRPPLAVCGGGHSIKQHLDEIRNWPGDLWLIGSSFRWFKGHGIDGTFFSVHPSPRALANIEGVTKAIVASVTDPSVLAALPNAEIFDLRDGENGVTTATAVPWLSVRMGYSEVTFFGCEGSYDGKSTHLAHDDPDALETLLKVRCGGKVFLTCAEMLWQSEYLAWMIRSAPTVFRERSGGLLEQMVWTPEHEITHMPKRLEAL